MYFPTRTTNHGEHGAHGELKDCSEELIDRVLTAATNVHRELGPGLLESVYNLKLLRFKRGYIINFKRRLLKEGIRRVSI